MDKILKPGDPCPCCGQPILTNAPLTLEELREMDFGNWVWIKSLILNPEADILTGYYRKMDGYRLEDAFYFGYPEYNKVGYEGKKIDLLPCPFCGGEAAIRSYKRNGPWYQIRCFGDGCPMHPVTYGCRSLEQAAADWNHRPEGG